MLDQPNDDIFRFLELMMNLRIAPMVTTDLKLPISVEMTEEQIFTLIKIYKLEGTAVMSNLSESMRINKSKMSRVIDSLVKLNLVIRIYPEEDDDRRKIRLSATEQGRDLVKEIINDRYNFYKKQLNSIPINELKQLNTTIEHMLGKLGFLDKQG
jgi:DNA-binding MarR family transcriptional regulator